MQTFTAKQWLCIDVANQYGHDKKTFKERLAFGREVAELVRTSNEAELEYLRDMADNPSQFVAGLIAMVDAHNGKPSGYPIGQDVASSGPQLLSLLWRCERGIRNTGVGSNVPDVYSDIQAPLANLNLDRSIVKSACVPHGYNALNTPKLIIGKDNYLDFCKSYRDTLPAVQYTMDVLAKSWDSKVSEYIWAMPNATVIRIPVIDLVKYTPSYAGVKYVFSHKVNQGKRSGKGVRGLCANLTHSYDAFILGEINGRCNYKPKQVNRALRVLLAKDEPEFVGAPTKQAALFIQIYAQARTPSINMLEFVSSVNVQHFTDECVLEMRNILEQMLLNEPFEVNDIHDEFRALPKYVNRLREVYNELAYEAYTGNWITYVMKRLTGKDHSPMRVPIDMGLANQILNADYFLS
jgi:hypothetical protein